jgi:hypothetical protein
MIGQCRVCLGCFTESNMETDTLCIKCWAIEELKKKGGENHKKEKPEKQGDKGLPDSSRERETRTGAPMGQLTLEL